MALLGIRWFCLLIIYKCVLGIGLLIGILLGKVFLLIWEVL